MRFFGLLVLVACSRAPKMTGAEREFRAWLDVFDAGDRAKLDAYHAASFPLTAFDPKMTLDEEMAFRAGTGGFEIKQVEEAAATKVVVLVQERGSEQFARATLEMDGAGKVSHLGIGAIPTPEAFRPKRMGEAEAIAALRAELDKASADGRFSGAIVVAKLGKPIFAQAYGLADRDKKIPNALATKFRIGSMNKMFTAAAVMRLVQDKKLALTDTADRLRPDFPKVTIQQLLTHTGGTGDIFGPDFDAHRLELKTHDDYVKLYSSRALTSGGQFEYSNYGYVLLGAIIESVSHESYYAYVDKAVFQPARMSSTDSPPEDQPDPRRAVGYLRDGKPNTDTLPYRGTAAGGGLSTVEDLLLFADALQNRSLLDDEHLKLLTTGSVTTPDGDKYAFGFGDTSEDGVRCIGHDGGAPGMNGSLETCDSGYTIAVLSNLDPPAATRVADFIRRRLPAH